MEILGGGFGVNLGKFWQRPKENPQKTIKNYQKLSNMVKFWVKTLVKGVLMSKKITLFLTINT